MAAGVIYDVTFRHTFGKSGKNANEVLESFLDGLCICFFGVHQLEHERCAIGVPVELLCDFGATVDGLENVAPDVSTNVAPANELVVFKLNNGVHHFVRNAFFHFHTELGIQKKTFWGIEFGSGDRA